MTAIADKQFRTPRVLKRGQTRPDWGGLPQSQTPGFIRGAYPNVVGSSASGRIVIVPRGQGSPKHANTAEHLICHLEGEAVFEFPDDLPAEKIYLSRYDILFIPANMPYQYFNVGETDVMWFTVLTSAGDWPPKGIY